MKASELIKLLETAVKEHGDLDVAIWDSFNDELIRRIYNIEHVIPTDRKEAPLLHIWVD